MPQVHIRPAGSADLPSITAIYDHAVRTGTATFELEPPGLAEMTRRYETLTRGGFPYLVAVVEDVVAGYAYAGPYRPRPAYRFTVENSIYLDEARRGQRIGGRLLQQLIAECEARDFRQMIAVIGDSANAASIGLHTSLGFAPIGTFAKVGFKFGRWLDSVLMQRQLGDGGNSAPQRPEV